MTGQWAAAAALAAMAAPTVVLAALQAVLAAPRAVVWGCVRRAVREGCRRGRPRLLGRLQ